MARRQAPSARPAMQVEIPHGGSGVPPPLPPPPAVPPPSPSADSSENSSSGSAEAVERGVVQVFYVHGGKLSLYYARRTLVAECDNPLHGKCHLTRTLRRAKRGRQTQQGRPLGLMLAWMAKGCGRDSKRHHWAEDCWPTFGERTAARAAFQGLADGGSEVAAAFLRAERKKRSTESPEPEVCPWVQRIV